MKAQVIRIVLQICMKALLDGAIERDAARERERPRRLEALIQKLPPELRFREKP
jgi:hypothetical protein